MSDEWTHDPEQSLLVNKNSYTIRVDRRLLPGYVPTPEEAEENARRRAEYEARMRVAIAGFESARGRWAVLAADETQPKVLRDLLTMHAPTTHYSPDSSDPTERTWVQCDECRDGDDNTMWPCESARVLAKHYAIEVPEWGEWLLVRDVLPR
jgi:hypothetical protein